MSDYALHPEAYADIDEIREYIAADNPNAADRVVTEIFDAVRMLVKFPIRATVVQILPRVRCASN